MISYAGSLSAHRLERDQGASLTGSCITYFGKTPSSTGQIQLLTLWYNSQHLSLTGTGLALLLTFSSSTHASASCKASQVHEQPSHWQHMNLKLAQNTRMPALLPLETLHCGCCLFAPCNACQSESMPCRHFLIMADQQRQASAQVRTSCRWRRPAAAAAAPPWTAALHLRAWQQLPGLLSIGHAPPATGNSDSWVLCLGSQRHFHESLSALLLSRVIYQGSLAKRVLLQYRQCPGVLVCSEQGSHRGP